jgi:3-deoxy-manno-octulosonate cytidylyltransferase (CMP-KDO synthetase)
MSLPRSPIVLIPARLAANRLPGKPLADIHGLPMIVHVWRRAMAAELGPVVVACAELEIAKAVEAAGGRAILTRPDHGSGSDRIFEALETLDPEGRHDAVINLQGDLPTIAPEALRAVLAPLADAAVDIATLVAEITDPAERADPNVVKAALAFPDAGAGSAGAGSAGVGSVGAGSDPDRPAIARALYFSRAPVPWDGGDPANPLYHHIGLYAYRRAALERFVALPASGLERRERLEQLRALEAGLRIDAALVDTVPLGVDTPADLARAHEILAPRDM